jgi:hypothetical protein
METKADPTQLSLKWFEIWRIAVFHPTIQTFSQIVSDPKASTRRGIIWMGITALIIWIVGPQRDLWWGLVANQFGLKTASYFVVIGTIVSPILGVIALLINAAMSHGLARLFNGAGTFHQLVFCWGVIQLPFILFSGLAFNLLPYTYSIFRLLSSNELNFSVMRIILLISVLIAIAGILYLFYAQVVAFSAVEKYGIGKGFGILILLAIVLGIASACLSFGFQAMVACIA